MKSRTLIGMTLAFATALLPSVAEADAHSSIPYVATPNDAVKDMLWMAHVAKDDVVYDLGSGDGRIVIAAVRDCGARSAVGIESNPERIRESRSNAVSAGVNERVEFIEGDLFTTDLRAASVVTLFLGHEPNLTIRPKLFRTLKPGTRIVSHQFGMGEWEPDKSLSVRTVTFGMWSEMASPFRDNPHVPDYTGNEMHFGTSDKISTWVVPGQVAGIWRGKIDIDGASCDCRLLLHQRLSEITGTFQISGHSNFAGTVRAEVSGDHLRLECEPEHMPYGQLQLIFDGHVQANTLRGTLTVIERGQHREIQWQAEREHTDFGGTWQWPSLSGTQLVKLQIKRCADGIAATYIDQDQSILVHDVYDCGGGLYFTLLIGRDGNSLRISNETGWLIGEAILENGSLDGKIEFYPYERAPRAIAAKPINHDVIRNWSPKLLQR